MVVAGERVAAISGLRQLRLLAEFSIDPVQCLNRHFKRYGRVIEVNRFFPSRRSKSKALLLVGPDFNRQVLMDVNRLRPTGIWPVVAPDGSAQNNLRRTYLTSHGAEHDQFAKLVSQQLSRPRTERHFERVRQIAVAEIETWPVGTIADVYALARRLSQRYAYTLLFGDDQLDRVRQLGELVVRHHESNWSRGAQWPRVNVKGLPYHKVLRNAEQLQSFVMKWAGEQGACPHDANLRAVISNLKDVDGCPLAATRVAAQLSGLALASYETTAVTLTWALFLLTQHPHVLADLTDELSALSPIADIDLKTLSDLPLLDGVIKETLRLITPVPLLGFKTIGPSEFAGRELADNALIVISPHLTHRLPEIYEAPDRFRPRRWSDLSPTAFEYLPFSAGPRRCPGYWFAITNLKVALAVILTRYRLTVAPGARIDRAYAAITVPKRRVPMSIMPQDRMFRANTCDGTIFDIFERE